MSGCTGQCCAVFPIGGNTRETLAEPTSGIVSLNGRVGEREYVVDMIEPLTVDEANQRWQLLGYGDLDKHLAVHEDNTLFSCRHWNAETRLCMDYPNRPILCSAYPYSAPCDYCGWTLPPADRRAWEGVVRGPKYDWSMWRWDRRAKGYRPAPDRDMTGYEANDDWHWDGEVLRPVAEGWRWVPRRRKWEVVSA